MNHDSRALLEQAIINPGSVFDCPEEVVSSHDLVVEDKIRVLQSWQYDIAALFVAEEEGMRGPQIGMLRRILLLLSELNDGDQNRGQTTFPGIEAKPQMTKTWSDPDR